ncbi:MAG: protein kinase [Elusimicrobia bacterium]|nr:protein kinase [Elusimicrobiota bacterium]
MRATAIISTSITTANSNTEEAKKPDITPERRQALESSNKKLDSRVETLAAKFPESPKVQAAGGEYWLSRQNLDKAVTSADRALELARPDGDPKLTSKALTIKGLAIFQKRDFEAAYKAGKTAHELDPSNRAAFELMMYSESALHLRGAAELVVERTKRALAMTDPEVAHTPQEWANQYEKRPTEAGGLVMKTIKSRSEGDAVSMLRYADAAVKAAPGDPMAYFQRGRAHSETKDYAGAILDLSQAMVMGWTEPYMFKLRAEALLQAGRATAAYHDAHMAIAYDPKFAAAYVLRGMALLSAQQSPAEVVRAKAAIMADLEKGIQFDPGVASFLKAVQDTIARAEDAVKMQELVAQQAQSGQGAAGSDTASAGAGGNAGGWGRGAILLAGVGGLAMSVLLVGMLFVLGRRGRAASGSGEEAGVIAGAGQETPSRGGARPAAQAVEQKGLEGQVLSGRYSILRSIGRGGMGEVYEARDKRLGRQVAIKRLIDSLSQVPDSGGMIKEARTVAGLKHENIVEVHDLLVEGDAAYCVFELIKGSTLAERISAGRMGPKDCLACLKPVAAALDYAHSRKIVHRDLKPANVMIEDSGRVKVMDFGIARKLHGGGDTMTQSVAGTPAYMAPEMAMGHVSLKSDIFALAVTAYEMLAGSRPFSGANMHEDKLSGRFAEVSTFAEGLKGADAVLRKALDAKPENRYSSAGEFCSALASSLGIPRS